MLVLICEGGDLLLFCLFVGKVLLVLLPAGASCGGLATLSEQVILLGSRHELAYHDGGPPSRRVADRKVIIWQNGVTMQNDGDLLDVSVGGANSSLITGSWMGDSGYTSFMTMMDAITGAA